MKDIAQYLKEVEKHFESGQATEHSYRPALEKLINSFNKEIIATNEPTRVKCGAPDFIVNKSNIPIGYIETKDIDKSLDIIEKDSQKKTPKSENGKQFKRYREGLENLILTNYLEFRWYVKGEFRQTITLAVIDSKGKMRQNKEELEKFNNFIEYFFNTKIASVGTPKDLARRMARIAQIIKDTSINTFKDEDKGGTLHNQLEAFRDVLLPSLKPDDFADMYAQTISYGLFSARHNYEGRDDFTREKAVFELPLTNPFLRKLFNYMCGPDLDIRLTWAVDELAELLNRADMHAILKDFGKHTRKEDPIIHFYETFLTEYDPKMREQRGVYYTPEPVVSYIVRSINHILKKDFDIPEGLADRTKIPLYKTTKDEKGKDNKEKIGESHKVLILDPAVGTGTFLFNVIDLIHDNYKEEPGLWSSYVREHLLPRIFGFELLMAPYTMAHMILAMQLKELNYDFKSDERLQIYLTNTLEEAFRYKSEYIFAHYIKEEAERAGNVKKDIPVMVVLGNPPYSGHSLTPNEEIVTIEEGQSYTVFTKGGKENKIAKKAFKRKEKTFIGKLIQDYFYVDGKSLGERNPKWLNDDYVKFIRFAQWRIEQTGYGVLAFITNHGYLDNPTFRGMRQSLMKTFDDIYILDLHGNSKKKEKCPDGSKDENVFDIQQGVAIGIFVRKQNKQKKPATVRHAHLWGLREEKKKNNTGEFITTGGKYHWLSGHDVTSTKWKYLKPQVPFYLFIPQDKDTIEEYNRGWKISEIMKINSVGIVTARDNLTIQWKKESVWKTVKDFLNNDPETARDKYQLGTDVKDWKVELAQKDLKKSGPTMNKITSILYRPFDKRFTYYTGTTRGFICRPRYETMRHFNQGENIGLNIGRAGQVVGIEQLWNLVLVTEYITDFNLFYRGGELLFPLYFYPNPEKNDLFDINDKTDAPSSRRPNLAQEFIDELSCKIKMTFVSDGKGDLKKTFGPEDIFSYMYAIFHSHTYRKRYAEFLKIDFPRLPLTSQKPLFRELCKLGEQLVALHLMEKKLPSNVKFKGEDGRIVDLVRYTETKDKEATGKVWINKAEYFDNVPQKVWDFYIGGYQVCNKWLKDRKDHTLSFDDIEHYKYIVSALDATITLMQKIDQSIDKHGGWPIQ